MSRRLPAAARLYCSAVTGVHSPFVAPRPTCTSPVLGGCAAGYSQTSAAPNAAGTGTPTLSARRVIPLSTVGPYGGGSRSSATGRLPGFEPRLAEYLRTRKVWLSFRLRRDPACCNLVGVEPDRLSIGLRRPDLGGRPEGGVCIPLFEVRR